MKKPFKDYLVTSILIILCLWSAWNFLNLSGPSSISPELSNDVSQAAHEALGSGINPELNSMQTKPIVMFVTSWCGVCRNLEKKLKNENLSFTVVDIEKNKTAEQFYLSLMGKKSGPIPVTLVGSELFIGDQSKAIIARSKTS
jgi:mycoredoxin